MLVREFLLKDLLQTTTDLSSPGKESACNVQDVGSIPGLGRSPGEGSGYPLQYSGLGNPMDCPWGHKKSDTTEWLSFTTTDLTTDKTLQLNFQIVFQSMHLFNNSILSVIYIYFLRECHSLLELPHPSISYMLLFLPNCHLLICSSPMLCTVLCLNCFMGIWISYWWSDLGSNSRENYDKLESITFSNK